MMISCLPQRHTRSFILDSARSGNGKKQGHEPLRAVGGTSHIATLKKKKHPSRLCPGRLYCNHHQLQTTLSKQTRGDFHRGEVSEKQTDAPALVCDGNSTLKVKGTHRPPDNVA